MGVEDRVVRSSQYDYATVYSLKGKPLSPVAQRAFQTFAALPDGSWVLDLGGGDGRFPDNAPKPRNHRYLAVELHPEAVERYRRIVASDGRLDEAVVGDITRLAELDPLKGRDIRGAVSWRVVHALDPEQQRAALSQLGQVMPVRSPFFLAVYSDLDWKAVMLREQSRYNPNGVNNCAGIMRLGQDEFNLDFFNQGKVVRLAQDTGFTVQSIVPFEEPTGYDHLRTDYPTNRYLLAHLERAA